MSSERIAWIGLGNIGRVRETCPFQGFTLSIPLISITSDKQPSTN